MSSQRRFRSFFAFKVFWTLDSVAKLVQTVGQRSLEDLVKHFRPCSTGRYCDCDYESKWDWAPGGWHWSRACAVQRGLSRPFYRPSHHLKRRHRVFDLLEQTMLGLLAIAAAVSSLFLCWPSVVSICWYSAGFRLYSRRCTTSHIRRIFRWKPFHWRIRNLVRTRTNSKR